MREATVVQVTDVSCFWERNQLNLVMLQTLSCISYSSYEIYLFTTIPFADRLRGTGFSILTDYPLPTSSW